MTDILEPKNARFFYCENCDFKCSKKSNYNKHILTLKHKNTYKILTFTDIKNAENAENSNAFECECGRIYKHRQSLYTHKKKCSNEKTLDESSQLILTLLQQNNKLQNQIIEMCKDKCVTNINNTGAQINSNNKTFNLNVFLNETCKDAMNITDFVDSLKLQLSDLENVGKLGYVEGISNIIVKSLNELDVHKRPVHCSDSKREVMYIKDEDKWEKENEEKKRLRKVIKRVADKNARLLPEFKKEHPDCIKASSNFSDQYNKLIIEAMGGSGDNDLEKEDKIIKKIAKNVVINKDLEFI
jgi:hypothetical protein